MVSTTNGHVSPTPPGAVARTPCGARCRARLGACGGPPGDRRGALPPALSNEEGPRRGGSAHWLGAVGAAEGCGCSGQGEGEGATWRPTKRL